MAPLVCIIIRSVAAYTIHSAVMTDHWIITGCMFLPHFQCLIWPISHNIQYIPYEIHWYTSPQIIYIQSEPLVPGPSSLEVETAIAKLKKYNPPGSDQIPVELYQAGGETLVSVIHKLITSIWSKEKLPDQWKQSIILQIHKKVDITVIIIVGYHCYQHHTKFYQISFFQG
jgi:hypothetical protein